MMAKILYTIKWPTRILIGTNRYKPQIISIRTSQEAYECGDM